MGPDSVTARVLQLMSGFAERTGLLYDNIPPVRYLWTDAFAVCNLLELFLRTGDSAFKDLALRLIDQVHRTLGRHRQDDSRRGWISGLEEREGEKHPTAGGLRIGKKIRERGIREPFDQTLEWERDGQYYHYLIKWMHALNQAARITSNHRYLQWAIELAKAAHSGFVYSPSAGAGKRMVWKMSIDLSRPQVASMGQHDPLDGLVTFLELQLPPSPDQRQHSGPLDDEINELAIICQGMNWRTDDPLGLGGLLCDAYQLAQVQRLSPSAIPPNLLTDMLGDALDGLSAYGESGALSIAPEYRLAFREIGLAIGLMAADHLHALLNKHPSAFDNARLIALTNSLSFFIPLRDEINGYWINPANQRNSTWLEHQDINTVMLATSLAPDCFLSLINKVHAV